MIDCPTRCFILTGPIGSGKTSALRAFVSRLAEVGLRVAAVAQPDLGRGPDRMASGFELELVSGAGGDLSRERIPLARSLGEGESPPEGGLSLGRFLFEAGAFERALGFVREVAGARPPLDVLGLDEIGGLELEGGGGLFPALCLALDAARAPGGPLLVLSAKARLAERLQGLVEGQGLSCALLSPPSAEALPGMDGFLAINLTAGRNAE
jgi:nucleoside-triphosphatase THEP1